MYFAAPLTSMLGPRHLALSLTSELGFLMAPLALQEMVFAVWLIAKGFSLSPVHTRKQQIFGTTGVQ